MSVECSQQTMKYQNQASPLSVKGNGNTFNVVTSNISITLTGNGNNLHLLDSTINLTLIGNGNTITLRDTHLKLNLTGNSNEIKVEQGHSGKVQLLRNKGYANELPEDTNTELLEKPSTNFGQKPKYSTNPYISPMFGNHGYQGNSGFGGGTESGWMRTGNGSYQRKRSTSNQHRIPNQWYQSPEMNSEQDGYEQQQQKGLNEEEMSRLPKSKYHGQTQDCSICYQPISEGDQVTYLLCFHYYHTDCCENWLRESSTCPFCLINIKEKLHQVQSNQQ